MSSSPFNQRLDLCRVGIAVALQTHLNCKQQMQGMSACHAMVIPTCSAECQLDDTHHAGHVCRTPAPHSSCWCLRRCQQRCPRPCCWLAGWMDGGVCCDSSRSETLCCLWLGGGGPDRAVSPSASSWWSSCCCLQGTKGRLLLRLRNLHMTSKLKILSCCQKFKKRSEIRFKTGNRRCFLVRPVCAQRSQTI